MVGTPLAISSLIELELRGKNRRASRDERKRLAPVFKVSGQPLTFEVRSNTRNREKPRIFGFQARLIAQF